MKKIKVFSYNIHKGFSGGIKKYTLLQMREEIRRLQPDVIFLQEVQGHHSKYKKKISDWPNLSQFEYLAHEIWPHFSYGQNAAYKEGHHGNAILSKFPIVTWENVNISTHRFEKRGLLHATLKLPFRKAHLHVFCTHLDLSEIGRTRQIKKLNENIRRLVPSREPLIMAGDFNDWRQRAHGPLKKLNLVEAFLSVHGDAAKTFPSLYPILCLDRIYFRGLKLKNVERLAQAPWKSLSDHIPLKAEFQI